MRRFEDFRASNNESFQASLVFTPEYAVLFGAHCLFA